MQANLIRPGSVTLHSSAARTATFTGTATEIPLADSYTFILDATVVSGTSPTMDVAIQVTVDGGTTWYTAVRFAQVTAATVRRLQIQPALGRGEAGSEGAIATTGGALKDNTIITKKVRVLATITGTNPSFTFALHALVVPKASASY